MEVLGKGLGRGAWWQDSQSRNTITGNYNQTSSDVQDENDPNAMKGFAVVKADSMEVAIEIAKSDPFLADGGTIRVSQMLEMN